MPLANPPPPSPKVFKFTRADARQAGPGDCFEAENGVYCLPTVINIGVQKAGTGELQTWLGANPSVVAHGGEVHFFDSVRTRSCRNPWQGAKVRLQYAKALWRRRPLQASAVSGRVIFEKTPAYFDQASPRLISCTVPAVKLVVMLRRPAARAYSAYRMCQREMQLHWCRRPFDEALGSILSGDPPRENHKGLAKSAQLRRMLLMGQYSAHLRRWLRVFEPARLRLLWLEEFKQDPFQCMALLESFLGLPPFDYRRRATRNAYGYWVVGKSKSNAAATSETAAARLAARAKPVTAASSSSSSSNSSSSSSSSSSSISPAAKKSLEDFYAPWQRKLLALVRTHNISLLPAGASLKPGAMPGPRELIAEELYGVRQGGGGTSGNGGDDDDDDDDDDSGDEGEAGGEGEE